MIPKIIWQTHNYEYGNMPDHIKKCMKTWINANPDWEHKYINHMEREDFVKSKSNKLYELYKISRPQAQSDIWRLLCLYEFGGVYSDMDSVCIKPLNYMLEKYNNNEFVSIRKYRSGSINIAHFAVPKKSPIMLKIIESATNDEVTNLDWHTWISFNKHIPNIERDSRFFDAADHSNDYKTKFSEPAIDYYGNKMTYREYLLNILKLNEKEYYESILND